MDILTELQQKSGLPESEIQKKIKEKVDKFKGLLNEESATLLVAKELGIEIDDANVTFVPLNILDENSKNVNVLVTVKRVFPKKEYNAKDKKGFFYSLVVFDNSKEMFLTVWNQEIDLKPGDIILVKNAYVSKYNNELKLNTSKLSEITKKGFKEIKVEDKKINELNVGDLANVEGVIRFKKEIRYFERDGQKKPILKFMLYSDQDKIGVVVWDNIAEKLNNETEGTKIRLENVLIKKNGMYKEINVNDKSNYIVLEKNVAFKEPELKKISELAYDEQVKIKGTVVEQVRQFSKEVCEKCGNNMVLKEGRLFCENCNDYTTPVKKVVVAYKIQDDSASVNAVFFTKQAMAFLSADESNIDDKINSNEMINRQVTLLGSLKKNKYDDEDFIVNRVLEK